MGSISEQPAEDSRNAVFVEKVSLWFHNQTPIFTQSTGITKKTIFDLLYVFVALLETGLKVLTLIQKSKQIFVNP